MSQKPQTSEVTLLHNPRCSTSRAALERLEEAHMSAHVVRYLDHPLDADQLRDLVDMLEDQAGDLVRRDGTFKELGLTDADVVDAEAVIALLAEHPSLMQRPVLVRGNRAIIGRPKERVAEFLAQG